MKNRGFTLIELLAVIVILSLIALIVFPAINNILKDSREDAYNSQVRLIERAAKEYYLEHISELKEEGCTSVKINDLITGGYITSDDLDENNKILDPRTGTELTGSVEVRDEGTYYSYEFKADGDVCNS